MTSHWSRSRARSRPRSHPRSRARSHPRSRRGKWCAKCALDRGKARFAHHKRARRMSASHLLRCWCAKCPLGRSAGHFAHQKRELCGCRAPPTPVAGCRGPAEAGIERCSNGRALPQRTSVRAWACTLVRLRHGRCPDPSSYTRGGAPESKLRRCDRHHPGCHRCCALVPQRACDLRRCVTFDPLGGRHCAPHSADGSSWHVRGNNWRHGICYCRRSAHCCSAGFSALRCAGCSAGGAGATAVTLAPGASVGAHLGWGATGAVDDTARTLWVAAYPGAQRTQLAIDTDLVDDSRVSVTAWAVPQASG